MSLTRFNTRGKNTVAQFVFTLLKQTFCRAVPVASSPGPLSMLHAEREERAWEIKSHVKRHRRVINSDKEVTCVDFSIDRGEASLTLELNSGEQVWTAICVGRPSICQCRLRTIDRGTCRYG